MRLEQFYHFDAAVKAKSIRKASEKIYTTPQNISKSLIQLEEELQTTLFLRSNTGISLTPEGELAYDMIGQIIEDVEVLKKQFNLRPEVKDSSLLPVTLVTCPALDPYANATVNQLFSEYENTPVNTNQLSRIAIEEVLSSPDNEIQPDLALTSASPEETLVYKKAYEKKYIGYTLYQDDLRLQVPKSSKYADYDYISFKELVNIPLLLYSNDASKETSIELILNKKGYYLKHFSRTSNIDTCSKVALSHNQCCFVGYPSVEIRPLANVAYIPLEENFPVNHLFLIKKKKKNRNYVDAFIDLMDQYFNLQRIF